MFESFDIVCIKRSDAKRTIIIYDRYQEVVDHSMRKRITKSRWLWATVVIIAVMFIYLIVFKAVLFPTKEEILYSDAFTWKSEKSSSTITRIFRNSPRDFNNDTDQGDLYRYVDRVINYPLDSQIILKEIIVHQDQAIYHFELKHTFNVFAGELLTLEKFDGRNRSLAQLEAYAHDQHGSIPVTVEVEEDRIQLIANVSRERFLNADFSITLTGFYTLKYERDFF